MRALVQVVTNSEIHIVSRPVGHIATELMIPEQREVVGAIGNGLLVLLGVHKDDTIEDCLWLKEKLINLRIFMDANEKMNLSIQDVSGEILVVSQFTLYANCNAGRRPSFEDSAKPDLAEKLYERFIQELKPHINKVETGRFRAHMEVTLTNNGPLTFLLDSKEK